MLSKISSFILKFLILDLEYLIKRAFTIEKKITVCKKKVN